MGSSVTCAVPGSSRWARRLPGVPVQRVGSVLRTARNQRSGPARGARGRNAERARGRYAKVEARRTAILDAVIHLSDTGDGGRPTLRAIAREVGIVGGVRRFVGLLQDCPGTIAP